MTVRRTRTATTGFLREFREFALKGNVVELAIAVIIGGAFGRIVTSFTEDIVMPLINPLLATAGGDWRTRTILPPFNIAIGSFLGAILDFIIIALALFLAIRFLQRFKRKEETAPDPAVRECPYCLTTVPVAASRCLACTSELTPIGR
ncbi:large conductance mechanosensitive channel protein MscL [Oculatella sp. LEGE 06141]|uniref:large conductance mechanosensitive channel protein MscL n=1 Tax=Oculatella sp. LEGE 06141 TaxID=1828648 RepID=UPI0018801099|nr:large conductance mechanosensitive channel protein MscL [Oculatella sp. LEGE 06141]MBE9177345.1 large conductance mechanosensitive channel protein MscL [Oculatella sp. LEGE 06141]